MDSPSITEKKPLERNWTFLTNHSHVLILLAQNPELTLREVSLLVGITERAVQRIVADLEADHYLVREREGRRNRYRVSPNEPLRHPVEAHRSVADLIVLGSKREAKSDAIST